MLSTGSFQRACESYVRQDETIVNPVCRRRKADRKLRQPIKGRPTGLRDFSVVAAGFLRLLGKSSTGCVRYILV